MSEDRKAYRWFYDNLHSRYYDLLMKWCYLPLGGEKRCRMEMISGVDLSDVEKVLDMCCGTGGATFQIARKAPKESEITGMDISIGQIKRAKAKNRSDNVKFVRGDVQGTGFDHDHFDKVFITHALHEMPRNIRLNVLSEAERILKNGGELVILELDRPQSIPIRMFTGLWFFYWLPFNFESRTRRDMIEQGLINEVGLSGFRNVKKVSKAKGILQVVTGIKPNGQDNGK